MIRTAHPRPIIFALWHNRLALSMDVWRRHVWRHAPESGLVALISASRDGALLTQVMKAFHVRAVRGSSSRRGSQALLELTTWIQKGFHVAITPDGPRGPRYRVQDGVISLAHLTGAPIVPVGINIQWKKSLRSWDGFQVPMPFTAYHLHFGKPIYLASHASASEREAARLGLEQLLCAINDE
jgi:lysophospholipid acyltransferase (LPLAT)-like uncharacterized protein